MGTAALAVGTLLALVSAIVEIAAPGRAAREAAARLLLALGASLLVLATLRLAIALLQNDFTYEYVAATSRRGASRAVRLSGLWGGAEGSLLLFVALLGVAVAALPRPTRPRARSFGAVVVASFGAASLFAADPFERLALPPLSGRGVAPILEHPAMLAHPPLLYVGTVLALLPALCADRARARTLAIAAWTTITLALLLGASWAYVELGWGGWWAWDPVENVALMPWLLLVATFHAGPSSRSTTMTYAVLWPLILAGTAMTRTSLRTSVHAFADAAALRWWLWPVTAAAATVAGIVIGRAMRSQPPGRRGDRRTIARWLLIAAVAIIGLGTFRPFVPGEATAGWFYTTMLFPLACVGAVAIGLVPQLTRSSPRSLAIQLAAGSVSGAAVAWIGNAQGWNQLVLGAALGAGLCCLAVGRRDRFAMLLGHLGIACVIVGALAGTTGTSRTVELAAGARADVGGHRVENVSVAATDAASTVPKIRATVLVDDRTRAEPSIAVYADRGLRLPEVATASTLTSDVQVILRSANDDQSITVTVNVQPLIRLVWLGALLLTASGPAMAVGRRYRRSRFDRKSSSTVDSGASDSTESRGGSGETEASLSGVAGAAAAPRDRLDPSVR